MTEGIITVRKGRDKPVRNRHPWIFSGAIQHAENASPGDIVTVVNHRGDFLARGYWNPTSTIQVRLLTWQEDEIIDADWWEAMLRRAIAARLKAGMFSETGNAARLVNAENDFLPGLILDRYDDFIVLQALTLTIDQHKQQLAQQAIDILRSLVIPVRGVYERSDVDVRQREGLPESSGVLWGDAPPEHVTIQQADSFLVDIHQGHKTGFYLDQQINREILHDLVQRELVHKSVEMLNLFSYTGSFGLRAFTAAADADNTLHVVNVDSSADALALAQKQAEDRAISPEAISTVQADCFDYLRDCVRENRLFDIVILDPPKFAHTKQQVQRAARGYKDLNLNAFRIIRPGGYLMTFSCSGAIDRDLFQKIVFGALADTDRQAQIVRHLDAASDHPVALTFPEGAYLKGLLLRVF